MTKILASISLAVLLLASCSGENNTPAGNTPDDTTKAPDYSNTFFPMGKGVKYKYRQGSLVVNYEIKGKVNIRGNDYYHWQTDYQECSYFYRASGDSVYENGLWDDKGRQVSEDDILMLVQSAQAGQSWRDTVMRDDKLISYFLYEVIERGTTLAVNGKTYTDVMHVKDTQSLAWQSDPSTILLSISSDMYYSRGVGLIMLDFGFGTKRELIEYSFK